MGGICFDLMADKVKKEARRVSDEVKRYEQKSEEIRKYLGELSSCATDYNRTLNKMHSIFKAQMKRANKISREKEKWKRFSDEDKLIYENLNGTVAILYHMCNVQLVRQSESLNGLNKINVKKIENIQFKADNFINTINI